MKIITVCGSFKFKKEMMEITEEMALKGNCMITPIDLVKQDKEAYTQEDISILGKMHLEKIRISDAILVVDVDGYIGESTKREIEYAKSLNKETIYYSELIKNVE